MANIGEQKVKTNWEIFIFYVLLNSNNLSNLEKFASNVFWDTQ